MKKYLDDLVILIALSLSMAAGYLVGTVHTIRDNMAAIKTYDTISSSKYVYIFSWAGQNIMDKRFECKFAKLDDWQSMQYGDTLEECVENARNSVAITTNTAVQKGKP